MLVRILHVTISQTEFGCTENVKKLNPVNSPTQHLEMERRKYGCSTPNIYKYQYKYFHPSPLLPTNVSTGCIHQPMYHSRIGPCSAGYHYHHLNTQRHLELPLSNGLQSTSKILAAHAARTNSISAPKFTPRDWNFNTHQLCSGASSIHNTVTMVETEAKHCIEETGKGQLRSSIDTNEDLNSRVEEVVKWAEKLRVELRHNIAQFHELSELQERLAYVVKNIQKPLDISRENQRSRNGRHGVELIRDAVEDSIHREVEVFEERRHTLLSEMDKVTGSMNRLRNLRHDLENDIRQKEHAKQTDECVKLLNTLSKDIGPMNLPLEPHMRTTPVGWLQYTQSIIHKSQDERNLAQMLGIEVSREMLSAANQCFGLWYSTNETFKTRITEIDGAKRLIEHHIHKLDVDIVTLKSSIQDVQIALNGKLPALQLAQSRIEKRKERPGMELCQDKAMVSLLKEMQVLRNAVDILQTKLMELETTLEHLLKTKSALERDLRLKNMALFIDRDKCLMLRQTYPISAFQEARASKPMNSFLEEKRLQSLGQKN